MVEKVFLEYVGHSAFPMTRDIHRRILRKVDDSIGNNERYEQTSPVGEETVVLSSRETGAEVLYSNFQHRPSQTVVLKVKGSVEGDVDKEMDFLREKLSGLFTA